jgi:nucleoside-diphosphate-sugar epimerase
MQIPAILVLGATGRLGAMLRRYWPLCWPRYGRDADVLWQARPGRIPAGAPGDWAGIDLLNDAAGLERAAAGRASIVCLAGVVPGTASSPGGDLSLNTALALAAVTAGAATGARVLLASSAAVYGARSGLLSEAMAPAPVADYGRAKAEMEDHAAALAARLGAQVCALRIGNVAGADAILGGWRPGFILDRFADGRTPRRSYIGPADLARVLAGLATTPGRLPPVLNLAAPRPVEMGALLDAAGLDWTPRPAPGTAIAEVALDTAVLQGLSPLPASASLPATMVAQWRGPHP